MKERPILFNTPGVQAILECRKTQTRRAVKGVPATGFRFDGFISESIPKGNEGKAVWSPSGNFKYDISGSIKVRCPYGQPGDRIWVRESARVINVRGGIREIDVEYQADKAFATVRYPERLAPAPKGKLLANGTYREASRILLEIVSVRVERLNEISEEEASAEGVIGCARKNSYPRGTMNQPQRAEFAILWESLNGPGSWEANPWVWVVEFKRAKQ